MISLYKCDRCKREFIHKGIGYQYYPVVEDSSVMRKTSYGHFCHSCAEEFFGWLGSGSPNTTPLTGLRMENGEFKWGADKE